MAKKEETIILKANQPFLNNKIEEIEEKYSKKFGCKVVILEAGLEFKEKING